MELKFGCDPEFFLIDGAGKYISAHGLFPGTKDEPFELEKGAMQVDGLALEFNIHPVTNEDDFNNNIKIVLSQMKEIIDDVDKELTPRFIPFATFDPKYFEEKVPDEAKILGCDPDFNYTGKVNPTPAIGERPIRTAAGHIHIGWDEDLESNDPSHFEDCRFIAHQFHQKMLFTPKTHDEVNRTMYYGAAGAFRPKSYGVELRSPSNLWVASEKGRREVFRKTKHLMEKIVEEAENRNAV